MSAQNLQPMLGEHNWLLLQLTTTVMEVTAPARCTKVSPGGGRTSATGRLACVRCNTKRGNESDKEAKMHSVFFCACVFCSPFRNRKSIVWMRWHHHHTVGLLQRVWLRIGNASYSTFSIRLIVSVVAFISNTHHKTKIKSLYFIDTFGHNSEVLKVDY